MPTEFSFEIQGLGELQEKMNRAANTEIKIALNDGLRDIGHLFVPAKGTGPLADATPNRAGKLARSTFFELTGSGTEDQTLIILQPAKTPAVYGGNFYGAFVRGGTRPHKIRARIKLALRWQGRDGETHFAKEVNHPGNAPNPYHIRTLEALSGQVQEIVDRMGNRVAALFS